TVVGKRVYIGSGSSRTYQATAMFCLDLDTGKPVWRVDTELPVWGSPTVDGDHVYFGLGNGKIGESAAKPVGAVICVAAATGTRLWQRDVPDSVLCQPLADGRNVYFGCRDGHVYAVERSEGRILWKENIGSPIEGTPRLGHCSCCGGVTAIY